MPLEFALRSRINLERPARRRRPDWLRVPPLALPLGVYWAALGAVFWALYPHAAETAVERTERRSAPELNVAPQGETPTPTLWAPTPASTPAPPPPSPAAVDAPEPANAAKDEPPASVAKEEPPASVAKEEPPQLSREPEPREQRPLGTTGNISAQPSLASRAAPQPQLWEDEPRAAERPLRTSRREEPSSFPSPFEDPALVPSHEDPLPRRSKERVAAAPAPDSRAPDSRAPDSPSSDARPAAGLPSCEAAAASSNETWDLGSTRGAHGTPDITRDAFARVLENGSYLGRCSIPASAAIEICAAVQDGKVVGITVSSEPRSSAVNTCVRRVVAGLRFPRSPRLDVTRTRFAPASP